MSQTVTLGAMRDYFFLWQLPFFALFALCWLISGPYLTRRALERHAELPRSKRRLGWCAQVSFLSTGTGLLAMLIVTGFFLVLAVKLERRALVLPGAALGLAAMLVMAWAVALSLLSLPARAVLRVVAASTGPVAALVVIMAAGAFVPAWFVRQDEIREQLCRNNLLRLRNGLEHYAMRGHQAPTLESLVSENILEAKILRCPGRPGDQCGYLYVPASSPRPGEPASRKIRICDRRGNHGSDRIALFADGRVERLSEEEFARLLNLPENKALAKLVEEEE